MADLSYGEAIPISSLNALEYCPRSFYYQVVQGETPVNEFIMEGQLAHRRVHQPGTQTTSEGVSETTRLYLASETLHLTGFADVIEEQAGQVIPVEYKSGRPGNWPGHHLQLCAQAMCLEELRRDRIPIAYGYIYYIGSQQRVKVPFTAQLRAATKAAIAQALQVAARQVPPPPLTGKMAVRCASCSLLPHCLPEEVQLLRARKNK